MKQQLFYFLLIPLFSFSQIQIGQDIDGEARFDQSGAAISISSDGNIIAIGATRNTIGKALLTGHTRVYGNELGTWVQIGQDIDGEPFQEALYGRSVSISSDGSIVAIGSLFKVKVYENQSGTWVQLGQNINGDGNRAIVSLSSNGNIIAIGTGQYGGIRNQGSVRVYENQSGIWVQVGQDIVGESMGDFFGGSVSISSDGTIIAIGAYLDSNSGGANAGSVEVYENQSGTWVQIGQDIKGEASDDYSGWAVALSSDGKVVAIGEPYNDDRSNNGGQVRVYKNESGIWNKIGQDINGVGNGMLLGYSVSLSSNGFILAIGVPGIGGESTASYTRIYKFDTITSTWLQVGQDINEENIGDLSGSAVSISSDGTVIAIGAPNNDGTDATSGHVRVYDLNAVLSTQSFKKTIFHFILIQ